MPTDPTNEAQWTPPFCSNLVENVDCPKCGEESVYVREQERYCDADEVDAYCAECHAALVVYACVEISFSDPESPDAD